MAGILANLLIKLSADSAEFQNGMEKAARKTQSFEKSSREAMDKVAKSAAAMGVAVAGATAVIVKQNLASIDSLAKTADKLGITTEALGGLRHAAELTGVGAGKMDKSLEKMNKNLGDAARGTGEAKKVLEDLNLPISSLIGMKPEDSFLRITEAISGLDTQAQKTAATTAIFGREGAALLVTMGAGTEGIRGMMDEAEQLGFALSRVDAAKVEAANDAMTRVGGALTGVGQTLTVQFAPYIEAVANSLVRVAKESGGFKDQITAALKAGIIGASYLADIWRGWELIFASLKVAFAGLGMFILRGMEQWDVAITDTINGATDAVNVLIRGINSIPFMVQSPELDGSGYNQELANLTQSAEEYFDEVNTAFRKISSEPMPSDNVRAWLSEVEAAAEVAAQKVAAASSGMQPTSMDGMGAPEDPEQEKKNEKLAASLLALEQSLLSEEERLFDSSVRRAEMVVLAHENELITQEKQNALLEAIAQDHQTRLNAISEKGLTDRQRFLASSMGGQVKTVAQDMIRMTQASANGNKAMFRVNQAARVLDAGQSAVSGAIKTWNTYPYPWNIPMTALHVAGSVGLISDLMGVTPQGGGTTIGQGGGTDTSPTTVTPAEIAEPTRQQSNVTNIYVQGHVFDIYDTARQLAPEIKRAEGDGINRD